MAATPQQQEALALERLALHELNLIVEIAKDSGRDPIEALQGTISLSRTTIIQAEALLAKLRAETGRSE